MERNVGKGTGERERSYVRSLYGAAMHMVVSALFITTISIFV